MPFGDEEYNDWWEKNFYGVELPAPELVRDKRLPWWDVFPRIREALWLNRLIPDEERDQLLSAVDQASSAAHRVVRNDGNDGPSAEAMEKANALVQRERACDIYELAHRLTMKMRGTALMYAKRVGDRAELARYIRKYNFFSDEMREYIAAVVEGSIPAREKNRHKSAKNARRDRAIVWFILRARANDAGDDASIDQAVDKFGLGRRRIQDIWKEGRESEPAFLADTHEILRKLQTLAHEMKAREG